MGGLANVGLPHTHALRCENGTHFSAAASMFGPGLSSRSLQVGLSGLCFFRGFEAPALGAWKYECFDQSGRYILLAANTGY